MAGSVEGRIANARVLITVKSYPRPSLTHGETDCVAGLLEGRRWARLYPVLFRQLPSGQRFEKWQWISCNLVKSRRDPRSESWEVDHDSLAVHEKLGTSARGWADRQRHLDQLPHDTIESLRYDVRRSLGWVRPQEIQGFGYEEEEARWPARFQPQLRFWGEPRVPLDPIPYSFYAKFTCDKECGGHRMSILDWEVFQLYRKTRSPDKVVDKLRALNRSRSLSFVVGTALRNHAYGGYMIVGLFYPMQNLPQMLPGFE